MYNYKTKKNDENLGFIAGDVPALLATADRKGADPMDYVAVVIKVVQEQEKRIDELEAQLHNQSTGHLVKFLSQVTDLAVPNAAANSENFGMGALSIVLGMIILFLFVFSSFTTIMLVRLNRKVSVK